MQKKPYLTLLALAIFLFANQATRVLAQTPEAGLTLIVSPAQAYLKILPGNRATHTITLENSGSDTLEVTPQVQNFAADGKTGIPVLLGKTEFTYLDLTENLSQPITLAPHSKAQLRLSFNVPPGAKNKEYPLSILFSANKQSTAPLAGESSLITGSLASNLVVLVSDEATPMQQLTLVRAGTPQFVDSFGSLAFSPLAKNAGYAAVIASGSATLYNWRGKQVAQFPFYPDSVLGFSTRELRSFIQTVTMANKNPTITPRLFVYDAPFLFGPYRLEFALATEVTQVVIWALPLSILAAGGLSVLTYLIYITLMKKLTQKNQLPIV